MRWQDSFGWRGKVGDEYMDAKYFDEVIECVGEVMSEQLAHMGKGPDDNVLVSVSSQNLRSLLDYCAILRPLLDAVELGEVEQYKKGLENGRKEGRAEVLEDLVKQLTEGHYHLYDYKEVADIFRLRWQGGGK